MGGYPQNFLFFFLFVFVSVPLIQCICTSVVFDFFPSDTSRECDGSGMLWYPLDTGIPTGTCICNGVPQAAIVETANMDPLNNPFGARKPQIVGIDPNGGS